MRELGSEFWKPEQHHIRGDETFYLSGRTALDAIVRDAVKTRGVTSVLLPSYCCHTMIDPFLINGIKIRFYDVYVDDDVLTADIPEPKKDEMLYIMKYFGDIDLTYTGEGQNLTGWVTTVEDLTHSCFTIDYFTQADYWFTSYRKWFAVAGIAVAGKREGKLAEPDKGQNKEYVELRNTAFSLKHKFMNGESIDKQEFLTIFRQAEQLLGEDYRDYGIGCEELYILFRSMDSVESIRRTRQENARILMEGLEGIDGIKVIADFRDDNKCPLFVPIAVGNGKRDALRQYLISKNIYCPVHWPLSEMHEGISGRAKELYGQELSLVCDQRYGGEDIFEMLASISKFVDMK